jgi:hypothetical protein
MGNGFMNNRVMADRFVGNRFADDRFVGDRFAGGGMRTGRQAGFNTLTIYSSSRACAPRKYIQNRENLHLLTFNNFIKY